MEAAANCTVVNVFGMDVDVDSMEDCVLKSVLLHLRSSEKLNGRKGGHRDRDHKNHHRNHKDCLCIPFFGGA